MTKERKYILIIGAILLLLGAIYRFFPELQEFQPLGEEIALKQRKLVKYQQMVQEKSRLNARLLLLNRNLDRAESSLLNGETQALAAVDIQNILNDIAGRSEVEVTAMRVLKSRELGEDSPARDRYISIPVRITISATIRQLKEVLYRIENSLKFLRVSDMRIKTDRVREAKKVRSTLTVEGLMKKKDKGLPKK
ncbi:MAG TPA: hypothetical protein ENK58_04170 [Desulfobacterales bacterium]|nr:hypothetical protein [Desulfobacterales bacterium]